jgi:hypothetical protein
MASFKETNNGTNSGTVAESSSCAAPFSAKHLRCANCAGNCASSANNNASCASDYASCANAVASYGEEKIWPFIEKFAEFVATEIPELTYYVAVAKMLPLETLLTRFKNEMITYGSAQNAADALFAKAGVSPTAKTRDKLVRYLQFFSDIAAVV